MLSIFLPDLTRTFLSIIVFLIIPPSSTTLPCKTMESSITAPAPTKISLESIEFLTTPFIMQPSAIKEFLIWALILIFGGAESRNFVYIVLSGV